MTKKSGRRAIEYGRTPGWISVTPTLDRKFETDLFDAARAESAFPMTGEGRPTFSSDRACIEFFFLPPEAHVAHWKTYSTLHLLRREMQECLQGRVVAESRFPRPNKRTPYRRLFAACILMCTCVDLLSKFTFGDAPRQSAKRFKDFLQKFGAMAIDDASALYSFRCALTHAFGLDDHDSSASFLLTEAAMPSDEAITKFGDRWIVSVSGLYQLVVAIVPAVKTSILEAEQGSQPLVRFREMYRRYGTIGVDLADWPREPTTVKGQTT